MDDDPHPLLQDQGFLALVEWDSGSWLFGVRVGTRHLIVLPKNGFDLASKESFRIHAVIECLEARHFIVGSFQCFLTVVQFSL
jgi:hypothetical protein